MGLRERLSIWASRDNYDEVMEYLSVDETKHAPVFDYEHAPDELRDLISHAFLPRSEERSKWLNEFSADSWSVPDGEAKVLLAENHLNAIRYVNRYMRKANEKLAEDGYFVCSFDTAQKHRAQIYSKHPRFLAHILYFLL